MPSLVYCEFLSVRWEVPACVFFFQAEDGIRDLIVTGVQTCALPICEVAGPATSRGRSASPRATTARISPAASSRSSRPTARATSVSPRVRASASPVPSVYACASGSPTAPSSPAEHDAVTPRGVATRMPHRERGRLERVRDELAGDLHVPRESLTSFFGQRVDVVVIFGADVREDQPAHTGPGGHLAGLGRRRVRVPAGAASVTLGVRRVVDERVGAAGQRDDGVT